MLLLLLDDFLLVLDPLGEQDGKRIREQEGKGVEE